MSSNMISSEYYFRELQVCSAVFKRQRRIKRWTVLASIAILTMIAVFFSFFVVMNSFAGVNPGEYPNTEKNKSDYQMQENISRIENKVGVNTVKLDAHATNPSVATPAIPNFKSNILTKYILGIKQAKNPQPVITSYLLTDQSNSTMGSSLTTHQRPDFTTSSPLSASPTPIPETESDTWIHVYVSWFHQNSQSAMPPICNNTAWINGVNMVSSSTPWTYYQQKARVLATPAAPENEFMIWIQYGIENAVNSPPFTTLHQCEAWNNSTILLDNNNKSSSPDFEFFLQFEFVIGFGIGSIENILPLTQLANILEKLKWVM